MAQTYKMMLGTSGKQWELLTVREDGRMTMTFHGTDREICHEVTENADGWLCYPGAMYPGLQSGKWVLTDCPAKSAEIAESAQPTVKAATVAKTQPVVEAVVPELPQEEPAIVTQPKPKRQRKERAYRGQAPCNPSSTSHTGDSPRESGNEWLRSAGYLAAATVALLVIYETGLLIPLGLIGLATSGLLK